MFIHGNRLYVSAFDANNTFKVFDISIPLAPIEIGAYQVPDIIRDIYADDDFIYIASPNEFQILRFTEYDFNCDCDTDMSDFALVTEYWRINDSHPAWGYVCSMDSDKNGIISADDIMRATLDATLRFQG